jgi:signal recognition particle subunit SRP54
MENFPGVANVLKGEKADLGQNKIRTFMTIMDSMTEEGNTFAAILISFIDHFIELDHPDTINNSRQMRIARGSGRSLKDVQDLMKQFKLMAKVLHCIHYSILK